MKNFYKNDWFLRIVSILVSIVLWIYVVYFQNPEYEKWIKNIPVEKSNISSEFDNGKLTIIESVGDTVNIKVRGTRRTIARLNNENIAINADLFGVSKEGKYTLSTAVLFPADGIEILQKEPYNYEIKVDKVVTSQKKIILETTGSLKEGFIADNTTNTPEYIKITGPESFVEKIDSAVITVALENNSDDIKGSYKVKLYDGENEIEEDKITKNIEYVDVLIKVLQTKKVDVLLDAKNADENITFSANQVEIKGKESVLNDISKIKTEKFDASNLKKGDKVKVNLILPDGVKLSNLESTEIIITVD